MLANFVAKIAMYRLTITPNISYQKSIKRKERYQYSAFKLLLRHNWIKSQMKRISSVLERNLEEHQKFNNYTKILN